MDKQIDKNDLGSHPGWLKYLLEQWEMHRKSIRGSATCFGSAVIRVRSNEVGFEERLGIDPVYEHVIGGYNVKEMKKLEPLVKIIQEIDKSVPFEKIMKKLDISEEKFYRLLNFQVLSGTKLNLDYQIASTMSAEKVDAITHYFLNIATTEIIEEAMDVLGPEFTLAEVSLVRNKIICSVI